MQQSIIATSTAKYVCAEARGKQFARLQFINWHCTVSIHVQHCHFLCNACGIFLQIYTPLVAS